jgi:Tfp pilus assembly ATPase PilU
MQTLDQSLKELLFKGIVSAEDALARSANPQEFEGAISALQPPKGPGG